jgi:hypothetical protein
VACLVDGEIRETLGGANITEARLLTAITAGADRTVARPAEGIAL